MEDGQGGVRKLQEAGLKVQGRYEPAGELPVHQVSQRLLLVGRKRTGGNTPVLFLWATTSAKFPRRLSLGSPRPSGVASDQQKGAGATLVGKGFTQPYPGPLHEGGTRIL